MKPDIKRLLKKYSLFILGGTILFSCNNEKAEKSDVTESVTTLWPNVKLDTAYAPDFSIDSSGYYNSDSIFVTYNDSIIVKHKRIKLLSKTYYLVEGDLLLDEYKYNQYRISVIQQEQKMKKADRLQMKEKEMTEIAALRINVINGKPLRWPENDSTISFCINRKTFKTEDNYQQVKANMLAAAREWMNTCNIVFEYKPEFDKSNLLFGNDKVDFVVLEFDAGGDFIAKSFFPSDPAEDRNLIVDPSYYTTVFDHVGVLRHELGHVLGWRHEHISPQAPAACPDEIIAGTVALTAYDPKSVMHYFCGGVGSKELKISEKDKLGAQDIYGKSRRR